MQLKVNDTYVRREAVGFVPLDVEYEVEGTYYSGSRGTYEDPPEEPEVEFTKAVRIDPLTEEREEVPYDRWPFSDEEENNIRELLFNAVDTSD